MNESREVPRFGTRQLFAIVISLALGMGSVMLLSEIARSPVFRLGPKDMSHLRKGGNRPEIDGAPWPRSTRNIQTAFLGSANALVFAGPVFYLLASSAWKKRSVPIRGLLFQPTGLLISAAVWALLRAYGRGFVTVASAPFLAGIFVMIVYGFGILIRAINEQKLTTGIGTYWIVAAVATSAVPIALLQHFAR